MRRKNDRKCDLRLNRSGSYIDSPKWLKNKKATTNPKNNDDECFQYALTLIWVAVKHSVTFVPNVVSLTCSILQILVKSHMGVFLISGFLVNLLLKKIIITPEPVMI